MVEETLATGRRKTAVASIRLRSGSGAVDINGRKLEEYFPLEIQRKTVLAPFEKTGGHAHYDMIIRVRGGGIEAQAIAVRLGLARVLVENDENLRSYFKERGFLTRDSRISDRWLHYRGQISSGNCWCELN